MVTLDTLLDLTETMTIQEGGVSLSSEEQLAALHSAWQSLQSVAAELQRRERVVAERERTPAPAEPQPPAPMRNVAGLAQNPGPSRRLVQELLTDAPRLIVEVPMSCLSRREREKLCGEIASQDGLEAVLAQLIRELGPSQARALTLRFGLDGQGPRLYDDIARTLGVSRQAAKFKVTQALRDLRKPDCLRRLAEY